MTAASFDRLIRIADRLGQVQAGSPAADQAIHQALDRSGPVLTYTTAEDAAQGLLPAGFELLPATYAGGAVYAACRRIGTDWELPHPHGSGAPCCRWRYAEPAYGPMRRWIRTAAALAGGRRQRPGGVIVTG